MFLTMLCDCICISQHCILYHKIQGLVLRWNMTHHFCCCDGYLKLILKNFQTWANHFGLAINYRMHILGCVQTQCCMLPKIRSHAHKFTLLLPCQQLLDLRSSIACEHEESLAFGDGVPWGVRTAMKLSVHHWHLPTAQEPSSEKLVSWLNQVCQKSLKKHLKSAQTAERPVALVCGSVSAVSESCHCPVVDSLAHSMGSARRGTGDVPEGMGCVFSCLGQPTSCEHAAPNRGWQGRWFICAWEVLLCREADARFASLLWAFQFPVHYRWHSR